MTHDPVSGRTRESSLGSERGGDRMLLGVAAPGQAAFRARADGACTWASVQWIALTGLSADESLGTGWTAAIHADDLAPTQEAWRLAGRRGVVEIHHRIRSADGGYGWRLTRAGPAGPDPGALTDEWVGVSTDVDALKKICERQAVQISGLPQRGRSLMALLRAMVRRSAESAEYVEDYVAHLEGRLSALGLTQSALSRDPDGKIDLEALVAEELSASVIREGEQVRLSGPKVRLRGRAAEIMALAAHELTTNTVKHGDLSKGRGRLAVTWSLNEEDGGSRLAFRWRETGVQSAEDLRRGFASELLERALPYELGATTGLTFEGGALDCTIDLPLD